MAYIAANRFTVADLCVASVVSWVRPAPDVLSQFPAVDAWLTACASRPAHKQARGMK
jgi:glutathione S-transferase